MLNLNFRDIFKENSLRNLITPYQSPMPHSWPTFYITVHIYSGSSSEVSSIALDISDILQQENAWSRNSIQSYIDINLNNIELAERLGRYIEHGPGSRSSSLQIEVILIDENARIISRGWGSSSDVLYDGPSKPFLLYLKQYQNRG